MLAVVQPFLGAALYQPLLGFSDAQNRLSSFELHSWNLEGNPCTKNAPGSEGRALYPATRGSDGLARGGRRTSQGSGRATNKARLATPQKGWGPDRTKSQFPFNKRYHVPIPRREP